MTFDKIYQYNFPTTIRFGAGAIQELPDGRLVLLGTMTTGKPDVGELKMTLIKVNQDGKLLQ